MHKKMRVLLLGPTGRIGKNFVNDYFSHSYDKYYDLFIGKRVSSKFNDSRFEVRYADLTDFESLKKAFKGIDVVVNLAANANQDADFNELVEPNIVGTYNLLEAARVSGVKRVITASSVHAIKGYRENKVVKEIDTPRPVNFYGATKAFVEALCHVYYKKYGLSCLVIRIGAYVSDDMKRQVCFTRDNYDYVITQRDMAQLIHKSIIAKSSLKYAVLNGSSDNRRNRFDLRRTKKLINYTPEDDAFAICEELKKMD